MTRENDLTQLKQIVVGSGDEEEQLKRIQDFEARTTLKKFDILNKFQDLVLVAPTLPTLQQIIAVYARKFVALLEEFDVLESSELSRECLSCLKAFWSLCSSQQNCLTSSQLFGKWDATLLESVTPLASILIDLSISAFRHKENQSVLSTRLYSWLNFDLPCRAIKVALLEATGQATDGCDIVVPLLRNVLSKQFDISSNSEYLLHFLLLKKWHLLKGIKDITEKSKTMSAPLSFLDWLERYWSEFTEYIPMDKGLKGAAVSQYLLDLDTDRVLDSLTDALQIAIFPELSEKAPVIGDTEDPLFVVDKKGEGQTKDESGPQEKERVKSKVKRAGRQDREDVDTLSSEHVARKKAKVDTKSDVADESPGRKKKKKTGAGSGENSESLLGFVLDRSSTQNGLRQESMEVDEEEQELEESSLLEVLEVSSKDGGEEDDDELVSEDDHGGKALLYEVSSESEDLEHSSSSESEKEDMDEAEVQTRGARKRMSSQPLDFAAEILKNKQILLSDPCNTTSSYFASGTGNAENINVVTVAKDDSREDNNKTVEQATPKSLKKKSKSPKTTTAVVESVGQSKVSLRSRHTEVTTIDDEGLNKQVHSVKGPIAVGNEEVVVESSGSSDAEYQTEKQRVKDIEAKVASKLSAFRKSSSLSSKDIQSPTKSEDREEGGRIISPVKTQSVKGDALKSSTTVLKDWLRPPSSIGKTKKLSTSETEDRITSQSALWSSPRKGALTKLKDSRKNLEESERGLDVSPVDKVKADKTPKIDLETNLKTQIRKTPKEDRKKSLSPRPKSVQKSPNPVTPGSRKSPKSYCLRPRRKSELVSAISNDSTKRTGTPVKISKADKSSADSTVTETVKSKKVDSVGPSGDALVKTPSSKKSPDLSSATPDISKSALDSTPKRRKSQRLAN